MTDYCGSVGTEWVPDAFPIACKKHDACYENTMMQKHECDILFVPDMYKENPSLFFIVPIFFLGVVAFGKKAWLRAQKKSVE